MAYWTSSLIQLPVGLAHARRLGLVHGPPVDGQAHRLAHALVAERVLRVLEAGKLDEERAGQHGGQGDAGELAHLGDQLAGHVVDDVGLAALEHGHPGGRLGHRGHDQLLGVDRTVVAVEGLHLDLHAGLVADELEGARPDGLLLEAVGADLLVVLLRHHPAGSGDVGRPEQDGEVEEGLLEDELDGPVVGDLDALGLLLEDVGLGAPVVLVAELDVLRGDGVAVVELHPLAEGEGRALRVRGHREALGQGQMVVQHGALVLDEGIVQGGEEVVRGGGAVVLLGIEPAGGQAGVPGQDDLALGRAGGR